MTSKKGNMVSPNLNPLALQFLDIGNKFSSFITLVSKKYNLPHKELEQLFNDMWDNSKQHSEEASVSSRSTISAISQFSNKKKEELVALCKLHGISSSGKSKQQLIDLLSKKDLNGTPKSQVPVKKNPHGNYEHPVYHLVFNTTGVVIGRQVDAKIVPLTKEDVTICKEQNFRYETPKSFDEVSSLPSSNVPDEQIINSLIQKVEMNTNDTQHPDSSDGSDLSDDEKPNT